MSQLIDLQEQVKVWADRNFGERKPYQPLLGVSEEVGELCHAHLKAEQGIRGTAEEHRAAAMDAIGDIVIYLADYCNVNGYGLAECIEETWNRVSQRNWKADPKKGDA